MSIPVKPVKLGNVKPLGSPTPVAPATTPVASQQNNGFNQLFGNTPAAPVASAKPVTPATATPVATKSTASKAQPANHKEELKNAVAKINAGEGPKTGSKVKTKDSKNNNPPEAKTKEEYTGPRIVKVYGQTLFTEDNPKVTLDAIRERIVNEFGYDEFSASRTTMSLDESTGIVVPQINFQKKG